MFELKAECAMLAQRETGRRRAGFDVQRQHDRRVLADIQWGHAGQGSEDGGIAVKVAGGAEFTQGVVAAGKSVSRHKHRERDDGSR
ncbi:hypothetical protein [Burkholderia ambifaria]|uniref:hypothetical protein n=1 Tax=Burkholderia ambifaria TaxID=152480 RepID=UPI00158E0B5E|nr:hypothetical protein [Burkholderia ambifaria]